MDGYVTIGTKLDTSGIEKGLNNMTNMVNKKMSGLENTVNKTFSLIKNSIIGAGILLALKAITNELGNAVERLDTMKNYENVMGNLGINSADAQASIQRLSEALKGLPTTLNDAALSVQRFTSANGNIKASTEMYLALNNAILAGGASMQLQQTAMEQLSQSYAKGKPDMMEWRTAMTAMPAQLKQVAQVMGFASADALGESLRNGTTSMNEFMVTLTKMNKQGLNGFKSLEEQARNSTGGIGTSIANVKNALTRGLADIMDTIGRSNIAGFFDGIRNAIDAVIPYIQAFIKLIQTAIGYIAGLFGKKAKKQTDDTKKSVDGFGSSIQTASDNMGSATGNAKKLNKQLNQLASFDEMNVLQDNSSSGGGSGGSGGAGGGGLEDIDLSAFDKLSEASKKVDEIFQKMKKNILDFYNTLRSTLRGLGFDNIVEHIMNIGRTIKAIFTDPAVLYSSQNWVNTTIEAFKSIGYSIAQIASNIVELFVGSIDLYLSQNKDRITDFIVKMFDISSHMEGITAQFFEALAKISEVFTSPEAKQIGEDFIAIIVNPLMSLTELLMKFADDIITYFFQPIIDHSEDIKTALDNTIKAIQPLFDTLAEAVTYIGDKWNQVYDENIHPFFEELTKGVSDTLGKFLEVYNKYIVPFIDDFSKDIGKLWNDHLQPFVDAFSGLIGSIVDALKVLYQKWLKPIIDFIIQNIVPIVIPIIQQIWNVIKTVFTLIIDIVTHFINVIKGVIDFVVGVFTGDWDKAWNGIKSIFESVINTIKKIVKTVIDFIKNTFKNGLEAAKNTISAILNGIKTKFSDIFNGIGNIIKNVMGTISNVMSTGWNGIWNTIKGIINRIIGGVEKMANSVIRGINKMFKPLADVGNKVLSAVGISGFKFSTIGTISLPRLAKGGIINMPGSGVAIGGERGQEGVIPLTDSQQMALLGEAIGKYITINANITNTMNGRVISRELQKINNESDFAFNG